MNLLQPQRILVAVSWTMVVTFFALALLVGIVIPIHSSDALTFGEWSRLISEHWGWHYPSITAQAYGRPLFYALQGWLWSAIGFNEPAGRILSLSFSAILVLALAWLVRGRSWGSVCSALVVLFLLLVPDFARHVAAGLTDVPTSAMVALTGAIVWRVQRLWLRVAGAFIAAALAMLAKPSALLALLGLALAMWFVGDSWRDRLLTRAAPVIGGLALALIYDETQARYVRMDLRGFLEAGATSPYYRDLAARSRRPVLLDVSWLGSALRVLVLFAVVYALLRVAALHHRRAVEIGVGSALLLSWLLPWLAVGEKALAVGSLASAGSALAATATAVLLLCSMVAPDDSVTSRRELAAALVWFVPPFVGWASLGVYETRLLAPAWPSLLVLAAFAALPSAAYLVARGPAFAVVPVAFLVVGAADNIYLLDNLQHEGWDELRRTPTSDWSHRDTTRAIVLPALSRALVAVRGVMQDQELLMSPEGAFRFFYPGRVEQSFPNACADLSRFGAFVLTTDQGSRDYMERFLHIPSDPAYWASCREPRLRQLTDGSDGYAVYDVGP